LSRSAVVQAARSTSASLPARIGVQFVERT
jgi:hypothetical protein